MRLCLSLLFLAGFLSSHAQKYSIDSARIYKMKYGLDVPTAAAGTVWTLYGFSKIYGRNQSDTATILALNPAYVNSFDRPVTKNYSPSAFNASNMFFYGSMPLPLLLLADKKIRKDAPQIGLLYLEAMAITGTVYTVSAMSANRYRPYTYNPDVPLSTRLKGGGRNSFFAGHVGLVGTSTFFVAKVYTDYHPEMRNKWILFALAGGLTTTTGVLRIEAGQHFKTDVLTGMAVGTLSGILVPHFHKKHRMKEQRISLEPYWKNDATGFTAYYRL